MNKVLLNQIKTHLLMIFLKIIAKYQTQIPKKIKKIKKKKSASYHQKTRKKIYNMTLKIAKEQHLIIFKN